jgi:hypothetical protein
VQGELVGLRHRVVDQKLKLDVVFKGQDARARAALSGASLSVSIPASAGSPRYLLRTSGEADARKHIPEQKIERGECECQHAMGAVCAQEPLAVAERMKQVTSRGMAISRLRRRDRKGRRTCGSRRVGRQGRIAPKKGIVAWARSCEWPTPTETNKWLAPLSIMASCASRSRCSSRD